MTFATNTLGHDPSAFYSQREKSINMEVGRQGCQTQLVIWNNFKYPI